MLVHVQGSTTTIAHSEDHGSTTTHDITTGEDLATRRLHLLTDGNRVLAAKLKTWDRLRYQWVGGYTNSHDDLIDIQCNGLALNGYRTTTA